MEDPRTAPSLSPVEAEGFFATGSDARSAAPGTQPGFAPQLLDSPGGSGGTGAAGAEPEKGAAGGPENQADGCGDSVRFECPHCGPVCYGGAAHNARVEDGVFYRAGQGNPPAAEPSDLRCGDCRRLRRSLPRHAPGCRYAGQNCPGCVYAEQPHVASCPIATQLKLPTDTCCDGVDMPSQGHVHSPTCGNKRPVARASYTLEPDVAKVRPPEDGSDYRTGTLYRGDGRPPKATPADGWGPGGEPFRIAPNEPGSMADSNGEVVAVFKPTDAGWALALRTVVALNACVGIPTDMLAEQAALPFQEGGAR